MIVYSNSAPPATVTEICRIVKQKLWPAVQFTLLFTRTMMVRFTVRARHFSVLVSTWVVRPLSLVIKWSEEEADFSPPSSAEAESGAAPPLPYTLSLRGQGLQSTPHSSFI